jgi:undecaprenyl-diphosphatase
VAYVNAILLAIVEGVTEFLPVSSTGHLILVEAFLRLSDDTAFNNAFMVIIQLPAILAVVAYFWRQIWPFGTGADTEGVLLLWTKIVVAFLPAAVLGFLLDDLIDAYLFNPAVVACALIAGGIVLWVLERNPRAPRFNTVHEVGYRTAFLVGCFQCLAMVPGTSRSAATIIGALALGASRPAAAEFSFFLAIPTMLGATSLKILKGGLDYTADQWMLLAVGSVVSFLVAYAVIAAFMGYIQRHTFVPFAYYRIAVGLLVLAFLVFR